MIELTFTPIQLLLTVLLLLIAIASLRLFRNKLLYRLFFILIICVGILFTAMPSLPAYLATLTGVGRGVDLVFYLLFIVFLFAIIILYRRLLQHDLTLTQIIRQAAIKNATILNPNRTDHERYSAD